MNYVVTTRSMRARLDRMARCLVATVCLGSDSAIADSGQTPQADSVEKDYRPELPRIPPTEAKDALSTFQVQPGFRLQMVAAEPMITDPVAMAFDEHARLYVVEMRGYSEDGDKKIGTVRRLVDHDRDGRFDQSTPFLEGLTWPTAVTCYEGGIFVGVAPDILYAKDTDGDGRADWKQVVFTGFGTDNIQGLLNSFCWGLDNRIHGATSHNGGTIRRAHAVGTDPIRLNGRDFAFDPRTMKMTATSGGGQHGMSFDRWGNKYVCSNSDHIQLVMLEDRYVARNPFFAVPRTRTSIAADGPAADVFRISPVEPWRIVRTRLRVKGVVEGPIEGGGKPAGYFTSATGITIYHGDAFPQGYLDNAFIGDVGGNLVHRKVIEPDGVSRIARRREQGTEFLRSTDVWFRPVQMANAPDGTLYILDMYREVIEHPLSLPPPIKRHLDLTSGRDRGRIYRVVPDNFRQTVRLLPGEATTAQLIQMLKHPNGWHRETAARLMYERQPAGAAGELVKLARNSAEAEGRIAALHALASLDELGPPLLVELLSDAHPRVREHAVGVSEEFIATAGPLRHKLYAMVCDEDARVRYQLALTLGEASGPDRNAALAALARRDVDDYWSRTAIVCSLAHGCGQVFTELIGHANFRRTEPARALLAQLARQMGAQNRPGEITAALGTLRLLPPADEALAQRLVRSLMAGAGKRADQLHELVAGEAKAEVICFMGQLVASARQTALDDRRTPDERLEATRSLGLDEFRHVAATLQALLDHRQQPEIQIAAVQTIGEFDQEDALRLLVDAWPTMTPQVRQEAMEAIFSRRSWIRVLLDQIEQHQFDVRDIELWRAQTLLAFDDPDIRRRANQLLDARQTSNRQQIIGAYASTNQLKGDINEGRQWFRKVCATCHQLEGHGDEIGPNLATLKNRGAEVILLNILDPNRQLDPAFENYVIQTVDGRLASGIIASETATSITLRRAGQASDTILRREIDQMRNTRQSIMPEGLEKEIDLQAMADLIAYLLAVE